jgi:hypothetical protein
VAVYIIASFCFCTGATACGLCGIGTFFFVVLYSKQKKTETKSTEKKMCHSVVVQETRLVGCVGLVPSFFSFFSFCCYTGATACELCGIGTFSLPGASTCSSCPEGWSSFAASFLKQKVSALVQLL